MINYKIIIGGEDYTQKCALPFGEQYVLNSALDNATLTIPMIARKELFKPDTLVEITKNTEEPYAYYVAQDKCTEIVGSGLYTHELVLIEETKYLEKKVVDTNTTTQPLVHDYSKEAGETVYVSGYYNNPKELHYYNSSLMKPLYDTTSITLPAIRPWFDQSYDPLGAITWAPLGLYDGSIKIFDYDDRELKNPIKEFSINQRNPSDELWQQPFIVNLEDEKSYIVQYYYKGTAPLTDTFLFSIKKYTTPKSDKSITDVVNRLLAITETLREDENGQAEPEFVFNSEQAKIYGQRYLLIKDAPTLTELEANFEFITNNENYETIIIDNSSITFTRTNGQITTTTIAYINSQWTNENYKKLLYSTKLPTNIAEWLADNTTVYDTPIYPAPEFSMTKSTLRECLDQVGGYIHSIVRLKGKTIYFDKLGGITQSVLDENYIGEYETLNTEQYATQLDSVVSNLVNIDNAAQGVITEPFIDAYETVRAETGTIRIGDGSNDTSAIIETEYPIEKIHKLICGYIKLNGQDVLVGDITPYVYESSEYGLLSSTGGTFPYSKGYAITYTQGQPNIRGLTFKLPNAISPIFSNQAILNIISQKLGQPIQTLFNVQNITELNFQLIYYPSTTARVKQSKTNITDYDRELTTIYNQNANKVDSRAYGENLKGAIARLGNIEKFITFTISDPKNLPNVGDYVIINNEDYYIATLDILNYSDQIKYTAGLSKDFNDLSRYIGIKNNVRLYEVSEKQSVERFVTYDDYCVIGNAITSDNKQLITPQAIMRSVVQFNGLGGDYPVSVARLKGFDVNGKAKQQVDLPVFSLGIGNSIWLGCKYRDNYSAGNDSELGANGGTGSSDTYYRVQNYVPYCDEWGELETLEIKIYPYLYPVNNTDLAISSGNALPKSTLSAISSPKFDTNNKNLIIKKDSREQLNFSYQLYFVTNDNIIIGSQLGQGNSLVTNTMENIPSASLYILPTRINKFATKIDLTNATLIRNYDQDNTHITANNTQVIFANETATASGKSWVLVDNASGNLLFGKNIAIENGEAIKMPTMTFTHKVI